MPDQTPNLALPWLMPAQAQKHVTVNEALGRLDALVQTSVESRTTTAQPATPLDGEAYILPASPTGDDWSALSQGALSYFQDGAWHEVPARAGLLVHVRDEGAMVVFDGSAWVSLATLITALSNLTELGVGTAPDASNPFAAKLNSALWTALTTGEGGSGDLRFTLNKEAAGNTGSFLFQTGWSGRAEFGLTGSDDFAVKLSSDGSSFAQVLTVTASGKLGVNTDSPSDAIHLKNDGDTKTRLLVENDRATNQGQAQLQAKSDAANFFILSHGSAITINRWGQTLNGWNEFLSFDGNGLALGSFNADPVVIGTAATARLHLTGDGKIGVHTSSPTTDFDIDADTLRLRQARTPTSSSATGAVGEMCWDSDYVYVCTASDTWKRAALSTW
jgi:hypothetical protein